MEKVSGQTLEQFWYVIYLRIILFYIVNSKEHFFDPLGMKTSFFLTPDLKEKAVNLTYRDANGNLHPWANQLEIIEQDHTKGLHYFVKNNSSNTDSYDVRFDLCLG